MADQDIKADVGVDGSQPTTDTEAQQDLEPRDADHVKGGGGGVPGGPRSAAIRDGTSNTAMLAG